MAREVPSGSLVSFWLGVAVLRLDGKRQIDRKERKNCTLSFSRYPSVTALATRKLRVDWIVFTENTTPLFFACQMEFLAKIADLLMRESKSNGIASFPIPPPRSLPHFLVPNPAASFPN